MKTISTFILLAICFVQRLELNAQTTFGQQQVITQKEVSSNNSAFTYNDSVFLTDFDGDGDTDFIAGSKGNISWYKNDGWGNFSAMQIIAIPDDRRVWFIYAADLDGDGDKDVIAATTANYEAAWYENGGNGNFKTKHVIVSSGAGAFSADAADLDGDGDIDFLFAYSYSHDRKVAWAKNDGKGNFGLWITISSGSNAYNASSLYAVDVDDDGDLDIIYSYLLQYSLVADEFRLVLYTNGGTGNFNMSQTIDSSSNPAFSGQVYAADISNDGRTDIMSVTGSV